MNLYKDFIREYEETSEAIAFLQRFEKVVNVDRGFTSVREQEKTSLCRVLGKST
jgi:hypothetical protein